MKWIDIDAAGEVPASERKAWVARPVIENRHLEGSVAAILADVRIGGDAAVKRFSLQFDKVAPAELLVSEAEMEEGASQVAEDLKAAIRAAKDHIEAFHRAQVREEDVVDTAPGVRCWRKFVAIERVGLYIPGGSAPLFSTLLMLGIPARIAGCREIVLCSPPDRLGLLHPAILYAAQLCGGDEDIQGRGCAGDRGDGVWDGDDPQVYKIFGPGNQYVTAAKQLVQKDGLAIDMPAGPSEVAVYADDSCNPAYVAADLLSQAEHGPDSQVILVCNSQTIADAVEVEIASQLAVLPRAEIAKLALANSRGFIVRDAGQAMDLLNEYAAEHLILSCREPEELAGRVVNAGSVFLGHYSPESVGDYASGTNHVLPTNGYARAYSGVSMDGLGKKITFQQLTREGLRYIGPIVETMAEAEGLRAHANAVTIRMRN